MLLKCIWVLYLQNMGYVASSVSQPMVIFHHFLLGIFCLLFSSLLFHFLFTFLHCLSFFFFHFEFVFSMFSAAVKFFTSILP